MNGLTPFKTEQSLHVTIGDLGGPAYRVNPVSLEKTEVRVGCEQDIPLSLASSFAEEKANFGFDKLRINCTISTFEHSIVPTEFLT